MHPIPKIKIVIADDHSFFRSGFRHIMQEQYAGEIELIAEAPNGIQLVEMVKQHRPAIVITDIQMPCMSGIEACRLIKQQFPETAVIAFSMFTDTSSIISMIQAGADGYLSKTSDKEEIVEAIKTVNTNQSYYCSTVSEKIYGTIYNSNQKKKKSKSIIFGAQEKKVIQLICRQRSTKEIAAEMNLATKTVEHYRQNIQEKIGARNVVGIALYAIIHEVVKYSELV